MRNRIVVALAGCIVVALLVIGVLYWTSSGSAPTADVDPSFTKAEPRPVRSVIGNWEWTGRHGLSGNLFTDRLSVYPGGAVQAWDIASTPDRICADTFTETSPNIWTFTLLPANPSVCGLPGGAPKWRYDPGADTLEMLDQFQVMVHHRVG